MAYDLGDKVLRAKGMSWVATSVANWDKFLIAVVIFAGVTTLTNVNANGNGMLSFVKSAAPAWAISVAAVFGIIVYR